MKRFFLLLMLAGFPFSLFSQVPYVAGQQAPDFTITDYNGNSHHLYNYCSQGKYVLIDFFSYWCTTCLQTSHNIDDFYHKYGCNQSNVIVLGNESDPDGTLNQLLQFIAHSGGHSDDTYPQWCGTMGGSAIADLYVILAYPTVMLIGPDSTFISVKVWPLTSVSAIEDAFPEGVLNPMPCSNDIDEGESTGIVEIYPNPASDRITMSLPVYFHADIPLEILDIRGRRVLQQMLPSDHKQKNVELNIQQLPAGAYFIKVSLNGNGAITRKLFKY